jgi:hypothetical protein
MVWDLTGRFGASKGNTAIPLAELDRRWTVLASTDAAKAFDVVQQWIAAPRQSVPYLTAKIRRVEPVDSRLLAALLADLENADFALREKATAKLEDLGEKALGACRQALVGEISLELRRRLETIVEKITHLARAPRVDFLRTLRCLEILEPVGTPDARQLLQIIASGVSEAIVTRDAKQAPKRLEQRDGTTP